MQHRRILLIFSILCIIALVAAPAGATVVPLDLGENRIYPVAVSEDTYIKGADTRVAFQNGNVSFGDENYWVNVSLILNNKKASPVSKSKNWNMLDWGFAEGIWVRYTYMNTILKEEIGLPAPVDFSKFGYTITLSPGLKTEIDKDGNLIFLAKGEEQFRSPRPFAIDAKHTRYDGKWLIQGGIIRFDISLTGAVYPIIIDPTFTKLPNPGALPIGTGFGTAFSPNGNYLSVAYSTSPYITIYGKDLSVPSNWTKLPNPSTTPTGTGYGTAFSPNGNYLSVAHNASPFITIYGKDLSVPSNWTKLPNPSTTPTGIGYGTAFSPNGNYLSVAHLTTPFITIYRKDLSVPSNWTKLPNPSVIPTSVGFGTAFSPNGNYLSVVYSTSPYITIYGKDLSVPSNWTKLSNPSTTPTGVGVGTAFSPNGNYLSVGHTTSPYITIYGKDLSVPSNWTKLPNPSTTPTGIGYGTAFSPNGNYLSVAHNASPFITIYGKDLSVPSNWTKLSNPSTTPTGSGRGTAFSPDGNYLSVGHALTPFITIYNVINATLVNDWAPSVTTGTAPLLVSFNDSSYYAYRYNWSYDGNWYNTSVFGLRNTSYTFTSAGTYTVRHLISNLSVSVWNNQTIEVTGAGVAPVAAFACAPLVTPRNGTIACTDQSTNTPTGWDWHSPDTQQQQLFSGNITNQNPVFFPHYLGGYFSVNLIACNAEGCDTSASGPRYIWVQKPWV